MARPRRLRVQGPAAVALIVAAPWVTSSCGDDEPVDADAGAADADTGAPDADAGDGDASLDVPAEMGMAGAGGWDGSDGAVPPTPCAACGSGRAGSACQAAIAECEANAECQAMRDCVYGGEPGCPLGPTGANCVAECVRTECSTHESPKLFYAAELCSYCQPSCADDCSSYCAGFVTDAAAAECLQFDAGLP